MVSGIEGGCPKDNWQFGTQLHETVETKMHVELQIKL